MLLVSLPGCASSGMKAQEPPARPYEVDFRFQPPQWQTAIGLVDDWQKTLVDKSGDLLYDYPGPFGDFGTRVHAGFTGGDAEWVSQSLENARTPIVTTLLRKDSLDLELCAFAVANEAAQASLPPDAPRVDLLRVTILNRGNAAQNAAVRIKIQSDRGLAFDDDKSMTLLRGLPFLSVSHTVKEERNGTTQTLDLLPEHLQPGASESFVVAVHRNAPAHVWSNEEADAALASSRAYWQSVNLPYGVLSVPDANIQALFDSCIRNIWQAREIKDGLPAFQVGPTCYRGLWIVDGAFLLEAAAMVGAGDQARAGIKYTLGKQKETGAFEVLSPKYYKENGIVLWTCVRHALLTQDKDWLTSVWPQLEKTVAFIQTLRQRSSENPEWLCKGLIPPGDIDGGLSNPHLGEYTNVYWNLLGLKSAIVAERWLGRTAQADTWQNEYDDFYGVFRKSADKDMRQDSLGNRYLPTIMNNIGNELPQRAQWAFCHGVYPGQLFEKNDPLVAGNLAMLAATEQEGMVYGTGWAPKGFWNYFASFYGHAWLWQGNGQKANQALYAFANHAAPTLAWREEQSPKGKPFQKVGDMPHNWASAEFIRLTMHVLALDRGNELHLLEGMPAAWAKPGMTTAMKGAATPFGPLTFTLSISDDGKQAALNVQPMSDASCAKIVVHVNPWTDAGAEKTLELDPKQETHLLIPITGSGA